MCKWQKWEDGDRGLLPSDQLIAEFRGQTRTCCLRCGTKPMWRENSSARQDLQSAKIICICPGPALLPPEGTWAVLGNNLSHACMMELLHVCVTRGKLCLNTTSRPSPLWLCRTKMQLRHREKACECLYHLQTTS